MDAQKPNETQWKWRYSRWTGIMFGPIPVGIIIVLVIFVGYMVYKNQ